MDIQGLLAAYAGSQPKRAHGGIHAMSGFAFQAQVYLSRFVRAMVSARDLNDAGQVFIEALSDVAEADAQGDLILLQVKRTLTATTLDDAATEMAAIEAVAAARNPAVKPVYGIVCQYARIDLDWQRLPAASANRALVTRLLAEGRLRAPEMQGDPCWDIISTAWPVLRDPWDFYRYAFERAMRRTIDVADAERCRNEISECFERLRQGRKSPGRLLQQDDFDTHTAFSGNLEVGKRVTLGRWQAGQYMPRKELAAGLAGKVEALRQASRDKLAAAMPVLWLAGRSGAGKSVMLLNIASELVEQGARIWWLDAYQLQDAIDYLAQSDAASMPDVLAIDDVFDRDARQHLDIGRFSMLMDDLGPREWPVLMTCGPTEFADDFEGATRFQGFEVHRHELPLLSDRDGQQFVDWATRLGCAHGSPGDALKQAAHGKGLFVSLATELAYGDLRQFSRRFAGRVKAKGESFTRSLRLCLALNRLYLRAPADWLTASERELLEALNQDGDFALEATESDQEWMRLTHPHLSNEIYPHLLTAETPRTYAQDLADAFGKALGTGREALALRMLEAFAAGGEGALAARMHLVDSTLLGRLCVQAWQRYSPSSDSRMQAGLHVAWACWRDAALALRQTPAELLRRALEYIETAETREPGAGAWPAWWLSLWRVHERNDTLAEWAAARLRTSDAQALPIWSHIWQLLFSQGDAAYRSGLVAAARDWLAAHGDRGDWHYVWRDLRDAKCLPEQSLSNLLVCALPHTESPHWAHVWQEALLLTPESVTLADLLRRGITWLDEHADKDNESWTFVWRALLARGGDLPAEQAVVALMAKGYDWLNGREDNESWTYVWRALLARKADLPAGQSTAALMARGCDWLNGRDDSESWAFVWQELLAREDDLPAGMTVVALMARGCDWLNTREDNESWTYVWRALLARKADLPAGQSTAALMARGCDWLNGRDDSESWAFVWQELLAREDDLPAGMTVVALMARGCDWLNMREENESWAYVWRELLVRGADLPAGQTVRALIARGCDWLHGHQDSESWTYVWRELLAREKDLPEGRTTADLIAIGCDWLNGRDDNISWTYVWGILLERPADLPTGHSTRTLVAQGCDWLSGHDGSESWPRVWQVLMDMESDLPIEFSAKTLVTRGCIWLKGSESNTAWTFVWARLLSREADWPAHVSRDAMMEVAVNWAQRNSEHPSSPAILKAVLAQWCQLTTAARQNMEGLIDQWAPRCADLDVGAAGHLLEAMIDSGLGRSSVAIQRAALAWCKTARAHPSWPLVLVKCLRDVIVDDEWNALADGLSRQVAQHPNAGWLYKAEQLLSAVEPDDTQEGLVTLLNEIRHRKETPQWTNVQEWLASGEILQARVSAASKRMYVELPGGIYALTETVLEDTFGVGQTIDVRVVRVNRQKDRVHVERVALAAIDALIRGKITGHKHYGVFFRSNGVSGLILRGVLPPDPSTWQHWLPTGSEWDLKVLAQTPKGPNAALVAPPWKSA